MKKIKNNSGKLLLLGVDGFNVDLQPNQEILVPDRFMESFKSCLSGVIDVPMPPKLILDAFGKAVREYSEEKKEAEKVKEDPKAIEKLKVNYYTKEELDKLSFSQLRDLGYAQDPEVRGKSKNELINDLLKSGVKK